MTSISVETGRACARASLVLATWVVLVALMALPGQAAPSRLRLVQWSDVHAGSPQASAAAWQQALREGLAASADLLLLTGDQVDNKCSPDQFRSRQQAFLVDLVPRLRRSGPPLVLALGNNDLVLNYQTDPVVLGGALRPYREHLGSRCYLDALGNGVLPAKVGGLTWISVNSVIFSPHNRYRGQDGQSKATFAWLSRQLAGVRTQRFSRGVVIVTHIPPTMDLYDEKPAWRAQDLERLRKVLAAHSGPVIFVTGHTHRNELHALVGAGGRAVPVLVAGSLSAKFGHHPNWRRYLWTVQEPDGGVEEVTYRVLYPGHTGWTSLWTLRQPQQAAAMRAFVDALTSGSARYLRYVADLWAHRDDSLEWSNSSEGRRRVLGDMLIPLESPAREPSSRLQQASPLGRAPCVAPWFARRERAGR